MRRKTRLSVTVDADLLEAAEKAVSKRKTGTLSAWVNDALRTKLEHERRMSALTEYIASYEALHGEITAEEMSRAARRARARAIVVRGTAQRRRRAG